MYTLFILSTNEIFKNIWVWVIGLHWLFSEFIHVSVLSGHSLQCSQTIWNGGDWKWVSQYKANTISSALSLWPIILVYLIKEITIVFYYHNFKHNIQILMFSHFILIILIFLNIHVY